MRILIICKSDANGGAAIASKRLKDALQKTGHDVKMLVQEKKSIDQSVYSTGNSRLKKYFNFLLFILERLYFYFFEKSKEIRFAFSPAITGENISKNKLVKEAEIIHIHWFNQGFISLNGLNKLIKLKKPIVWTLHDMWAFTGGCHYSGECEYYKANCGNCKFIKHNGSNDLSAKILNKKSNILKGANIQFVTCSNWLSEKAISSALLKDFDIISIPNPIDLKVFFPQDKPKSRQKLKLPIDKKLILFGSANILDERKGLKYLLEALNKLHSINPFLSEKIEIVVFGKSNDEFILNIPFRLNKLGIIRGESNIAEVYSAADVFVLPSLEDNLPNTIMESLACGTPVIAFKTGGIPEMIDHQTNGYLAEYKSIDGLIDGIEYILNGDSEKFRKASLQKVNSNYNEKLIAEKYSSVYNSIIDL